MLKTSRLQPLFLALAVFAAAPSVVAQDAPDASTEESGESDDLAPGNAADAKPAKKKKQAGEAEEGEMDLRPGAVQGKSSLPINLMVSTTTSVGSGFLAPLMAPLSHGAPDPTWATYNPSMTSSLNLSVVWRLNGLGWLPNTNIRAAMPVNISWLSAQGSINAGAASADRLARLGDASLSFSMPGMYMVPFVNIGLGLGGNIRFPTGQFSQRYGRLGRIGGFVSAFWASPKTPVGNFVFANSFTGNFWLQDNRLAVIPDKTSTDFNPFLDKPNALAAGMICRVEEQMAGGCSTGGINLGGVSNSASASWQMGKHSVSWSYWALINQNQILVDVAGVSKNDNARENQFEPVPFWHGSTITYTYNVPVDFLLLLSAGVDSTLLMLSPGADAFPYRIPFVDRYWANNFHTAFISVTAGI